MLFRFQLFLFSSLQNFFESFVVTFYKSFGIIFLAICVSIYMCLKRGYEEMYIFYLFNYLLFYLYIRISCNSILKMH